MKVLQQYIPDVCQVADVVLIVFDVPDKLVPFPAAEPHPLVQNGALGLLPCLIRGGALFQLPQVWPEIRDCSTPA